MFRNVSESVKKRIAGKQYHKCANNPDCDIRFLDNFECPLWKINGSNRGAFDESGYEIDHVIEHSISKDDSEKNLQALCLNCHRVKTKRYATSRSKYGKPIDESRDSSCEGSDESNESSSDDLSYESCDEFSEELSEESTDESIEETIGEFLEKRCSKLIEIYENLDNHCIKYGNHTISIVIDEFDHIWFGAKNIAGVLGYKNTKICIARGDS